MEFIRFIIVIGMVWIICAFLSLIQLYILKFVNNRIPYKILRNGSFDNIKPWRKPGDLTYAGQVLILSILIPSFFPILFISESNYFFNLGFFLLMLIPTCMILFRINTFNDDSILPETRLGYDPLQSWVLSFLAMMMGLVIGFSELNFSYIPIYVPLITISLALISGLIPMFPDYLNRFLSYDIRSERGYWFLRIVTGVSIAIQGAVFIYFSVFVV